MALTSFGKNEPSVDSVKLHVKNQSYTGTIVELPEDTVPIPKFGGQPGEMATWPNGGVKKQWIFTMKTIAEDVCDCESLCQDGLKNSHRGKDGDNGIRKLFVPTSGNLIAAMSEALDAAKVEGPDLGGTFTITRTGLDYERQKKTGSVKPPVTYSAVYTEPTPESLVLVKDHESNPEGLTPAQLAYQNESERVKEDIRSLDM